jgi:hypothetical protein
MKEEKGEMAEDFRVLLEDLREEHHPEGPTEDILVFKMAESVFFADRAAVFLAERLEFNDTEDESKQLAFFLRYHSTADRAFSRHLRDLRKLQKERQNQEIGFVPQNAEPPAEQPAEQPIVTQIYPVGLMRSPFLHQQPLKKSALSGSLGHAAAAASVHPRKKAA